MGRGGRGAFDAASSAGDVAPRSRKSKDSASLKTLRQPTLFHFGTSPSPSSSQSELSAPPSATADSRRISVASLIGAKLATPIDTAVLRDAPLVFKTPVSSKAANERHTSSSEATEQVAEPVEPADAEDGAAVPGRRMSARAAALAEESLVSCTAKNYGQEAMGRRVSIFWRDEDPPTWFDGTVRQFSVDELHLIKCASACRSTSSPKFGGS